MAFDLSACLGPRLPFLDPREADEAETHPIRGAVNIPLSELRQRTHELSPRGEVVEIVGPEEVAERAVAWLAAGGREARWMRDFEYGPPAPGRLWEPNDWLAEMRAHLPPGRAIDLGAGTGRDAVFLAGHGWRVQAVDHLEDALARGRDLAARYLPPEAAARIEWEQQELEAGEFAREFDLVTMFFFLHRPLLARTPEWLRPGGNLVVETFTTLHRERHGKPRSAELALRPGELPALATGLTVRHYDEAWRGERHTARLWATVLP